MKCEMHYKPHRHIENIERQTKFRERERKVRFELLVTYRRADAKTPTTAETLTMAKMTEEEKKELLKEYHDRTIRWTNQTLSQLSFLNNLLLSISTAFLAFAFKEMQVSQIYFTVKEINPFLTYQVLSVSFISFSILAGIIVALYRLLDFRITRQINHARLRMCEHALTKMCEVSPKKFSWFKRAVLPFYGICRKDEITIEESKAYIKMTQIEKDKIDCRFENMRDVAHNLGANSWCYTWLQMITFVGSIAFFTLSILKK